MGRGPTDLADTRIVRPHLRWGVLARVLARSNHLSSVMPLLVVGIHVFLQYLSKKDMDGRDKPGYDSGKVVQ